MLLISVKLTFPPAASTSAKPAATSQILIPSSKYESKLPQATFANEREADPIIRIFLNDFSYEEIFSRQLKVLGKKGDLLVAISASGNSPNLVKAFGTAKECSIKTVALTSFDGGKLKEMADEVVHVPAERGEYGPAEDAHLIINHLIGAYINRLVKTEN